MKYYQPFPWLAGVILCASLLTARGAEQTAIVKDNFVNVRGQANLIGEVITQLKKGETVTVLEEITIEKPKPGDPAKWARIRMPDNTPVWVSAAFIDAAEKAVAATRLNLRAGPGENYSVVGRLERGDKVKEIRTMDGWMEIETPPTAYAFVAAEYLSLKSDGTTAAAAPAATAPAAATDPTSSPSTAVQKETTVAGNEPATPAKTETPPNTVEQTTAALQTPPPSQTTPTPAVTEPATPAVTESLPAVAQPTPAAGAPAQPEPLPKRIVRREGIVRSTFNIQAPTYFELVSPETRKTINYLHTEDPALKLKDFKGKKIIVTGEEGVDSRWPNTPVIEIESLEAAP